jgi:hypothetical protein
MKQFTPKTFTISRHSVVGPFRLSPWIREEDKGEGSDPADSP